MLFVGPLKVNKQEKTPQVGNCIRNISNCGQLKGKKSMKEEDEFVDAFG